MKDRQDNDRERLKGDGGAGPDLPTLIYLAMGEGFEAQSRQKVFNI